MLGMLDPIAIFLTGLTLLFLIIVLAYYLVRIDKRNKVLNAEFIKGVWERKGKTPEGEPWFFRYTFGDHSIRIDAIPKYEVRGFYKVKKEVENLLGIELFDLVGDVEGPRQFMQIGVDRKSNRLVINGREYLKVD